MKIFSPNIKGSLTLAPDAVSVLSGSFTGSFSGTATTASYVSLTNVDGFTNYSSSVEGRVSTNETDISSLTSQTSSYLQNTTDTLDGDLTVTGKITAQEFHTEFVSASIVYQSGSTKFGDTSDDVMSITGSIHQSGSSSYFLGNVGIGTTNPSTKFYLSGAGSVFTLNRPTIGTILLSLDSTKNEIFSRDGGTGNFPLAFIIGSTERMRIDGSGNVGIGTTNPSAKLQIDGEGGTDASPGTVAIKFRDNVGTAADTFVMKIADYDGGTTEFQTLNTTNWHLKAGVNTGLYVNTSGNVGIGTANPGTTLHASNNNFSTDSGFLLEGYRATYDAGKPVLYLKGNWEYNTSRATDPILKVAAYNDPGGFYILHNGRVGIGTTSPSFPLSVQGSIESRGALYVTQASPVNSLAFDADNTSLHKIFTNSTVDLSIGTNSSTSQIYLKNGGNVGIGTASPSQKFEVTGNIYATNGGLFSSAGSGLSYSTRVSTSYAFPYVYSYFDSVGGTSYDGTLVFRNSSNGGSLTERMRIDTSGNAMLTDISVNTTPPSTPSSSNSFNAISLRGLSGQISLSRQNGDCLDINRKASDGTLVVIRQDGTEEGSISVSGTTVSYNGGHLSRWSQLPDNSKDETIVKGTVMTNLDDMCEWNHPDEYWTEDDELPVDEDGNPTAAVGDLKKAGFTEDNEQLNKTKVSDVEGDPNVAGVFVNWDEDGDMNMAMTGDMVIRIGKDITVKRGDLLMSAGDGTAKPQEDDIVRSKTIAKVISTHVTKTYDDGSYLVPCVLMAC